MLFDTNIVIDVLHKRREYRYGAISVMTLIEVVRGVSDPEMVEVLVLLKQSYQVYDFDDGIVLAYSKLYQKFKNAKPRIEDADLLIAATAYAKGEALHTKDNDFKPLRSLMDVVME